MKIENVYLPFKQGTFDITIKGEKIHSILKSDKNANEKQELMAFPGLINMHDHLAMNNFPPLKNRNYKNYIDWSSDLHLSFKREIEYSKRAREELNGTLGEIKNILCGFTSVCDHENHNQATNFIENFADYNFIHSIQQHKNWKLKLNLTFNTKPWFIHLNEGAGNKVEDECKILKKHNLFKRKIIAIHGISMTIKDLEGIEGLIWCPASNIFLYNRTTDIKILEQLNNKVFWGSDSTLTGTPNLWEHIRTAIDLLGSAQAVYKMLTTNPASYFEDLNRSALIEKGSEADIVIAKKKDRDYWNAFYKINPCDILAVIKEGKTISKDPYFNMGMGNSGLKKLKTMNTSKLIPDELIKRLSGAGSSDRLGLSFEI